MILFCCAEILNFDSDRLFWSSGQFFFPSSAYFTNLSKQNYSVRYGGEVDVFKEKDDYKESDPLHRTAQ